MSLFHVEISGETFRVEFEADGVVVVNGKRAEIFFQRGPDNSGHLLVDGLSIPYSLEPGGDGQWRVNIRGTYHDAVVKTRKQLLLEQYGGSSNSSTLHKDVKAPMPGLVLRVAVETGSMIKKGEPLLVLEAMKMENEIGAPCNGVVTSVHVAQGDAVGKNALLIEIDGSN